MAAREAGGDETFLFFHTGGQTVRNGILLTSMRFLSLLNVCNATGDSTESGLHRHIVSETLAKVQPYAQTALVSGERPLLADVSLNFSQGPEICAKMDLVNCPAAILVSLNI